MQPAASLKSKGISSPVGIGRRQLFGPIALNSLVPEDLIEPPKIPAPIVRAREISLDTIGVYYDSPGVWSDEERGFIRSLHARLDSKLEGMGIKMAVFTDGRSEAKQRLVLPELRSAISCQKIQGLILPVVNGVNLPALLRLPLPMAVLVGNVGVAQRVEMIDKRYIRESLSLLAAKGCQSVALISSAHSETADTIGLTDELAFKGHFVREAQNLGMKTRKEWLRVPRKYVREKADFGYKEFHKLWSQSSHPDAVFVFPDMVVRGVIKAILELGVDRAKDVTFCFHRNADMKISCPFPALWAIFDEAKLADCLVDLVRRQHEGARAAPVRFPICYEDVSH